MLPPSRKAIIVVEIAYAEAATSPASLVEATAVL